MPDRVLHVVATRARRGAEVFAVDLASALGARGWPGRVLAVEPGPHPDLDVPAAAQRWPSAMGLWRLRSALKSAEVVVAHGSTALPAVAMATRGTGVPYVYRTIGDPAYWARTRVSRAWVGAALRRAAAVVALWPAAADELVRRYALARRCVVVVPTGVDDARFTPADAGRRRRCRSALGVPPDACPVVAVVAALTPEKDVGTAVAAMAHLPDGLLLVAGEGPERPALERAERACFLGGVERVEDVLAAADVLVLTSRTEGLPAVAIEAAMAGVPVVAPSVGGLSEVVTPGVTGVLFSGRDPAVVAAAITDAAGLAPVPDTVRQRYGLAAVADRWASLLEEVVGAR